jgi:hypothetical protein
LPPASIKLQSRFLSTCIKPPGAERAKYPEEDSNIELRFVGWHMDVAAGISMRTRLIYLIEAHYDDHSG